MSIYVKWEYILHLCSQKTSELEIQHPHCLHSQPATFFMTTLGLLWPPAEDEYNNLAGSHVLSEILFGQSHDLVEAKVFTVHVWGLKIKENLK